MSPSGAISSKLYRELSSLCPSGGEMWRSKAQQWLLRIPRPKRSPLHRQLPQGTLIVVPTQPDDTLPTFTCLQNPRLFSTNPSFNFGEADDSNVGNVGNVIDPDDSRESEASSIDLNEKGDVLQELSKQAVDVDSLSSLWEESVGAYDSLNVFGSQEALEGVRNEIHEVDDVQVESVLSLLQSTLVEPLEISMDKMDLRLSEVFAVRVIQTDNISGEKLVGFFKWASRNCQSVKSSRAVELLVLAVSNLPELRKEEAYILWDLIKEIGVEKVMVSTVFLNDLISMIWKFGKSKAGLEVFEKFTDFGCVPNEDSYYYTIEALGKRSMFGAA